ncbi:MULTISPECIES: DNA methyltransferase [unclassified Methylophilus]|uniref:DNA methyltransferase n=1 Tax=unclassified Methylophilus TaxID=2630143 RepID=UPI0007006FFF|nr:MULTISPECIES: DNA methyltransferase [unclassified Methylophilus]KQT42505.1 restriction endonuclease [Methylophilus sp. Leaf416]KQT56688.1 restriction endonuclease [Methylophilus sp. Leaf459]
MSEPAPQTQAHLSAFPSTESDSFAATYDELPLHTLAPDEVINHLKKIDWGFTDDATRFLGHDLHPYPAKFIPQIPGTFISLLSSRGELVYDPFGGSGTTALEAIRLGRRAISTDANPMAALIGKVKTARVNSESIAELHLLHGALRALLDSLPKDEQHLISLYKEFAPEIKNREKWFADSAYGELAHIRYRISVLSNPIARDVALLSLSRTVLSSSFQDSETRYKSVPRAVPVGETTKRFIREYESVLKSVARNAAATRYGVSHFLTQDVRKLNSKDIPDSSVDFIVTSPPYGNATDYHLYHRFRLLWLGFDPIELGRIEIGSHLKHQREASGFDSYFSDMLKALQSMSRVLKQGRYAVLVIGDSLYEGKKYNTAELLAEKASSLGFDIAYVIERQVHKTKRSFTAGRRATNEYLLILRKELSALSTSLKPPPYKLWPYEKKLQQRESEKFLLPSNDKNKTNLFKDIQHLISARSMVFTHQLQYGPDYTEPTWQAILENGMASNQSARKDPKYVTHGLHPYKGKFYPQLAKGLINQLNLEHGAKILDPFCGSGTTLLEGHLNGFEAFGCDLNPLAAQIARVKSLIIEVDPDVLTEVVSTILETIQRAPANLSDQLDQFNSNNLDEINRWFAIPVAKKINWILKIIRSGSGGIVREFLEVVLSSIVREVSQQDPSDLRIRYRKDMLVDAKVFELFNQQLSLQFSRIEKFWKVRGYAPNPFYPVHVINGDNRELSTYESLGLNNESIDLILTSPPYAMALPYIDTDRLSLLTIFGLGSAGRKPVEEKLIGSRELSNSTKRKLEESFLHDNQLPNDCLNFIRNLHHQIVNSDDAGFRKQNMPALIHRFITDMQSVLDHAFRLCKIGAEVMIVIGDSKMTVNGQTVRIPSTDFVELVAISSGFTPIERIDISVTTENLKHIKHAITENVVLRLRKN